MYRKNRLLNYKFNEKVMSNGVREAILHFLVQDNQDRGPEGPEDDERLITITTQIVRLTKPGDSTIWSSHIVANASSTITRQQEREGRWLKVDLTSLVMEVFALPRDGLVLIIKAQDSEGRRLLVPDAKAESANTMPYVEVLLEDTSRRSKRGIIGLTCNEDSPETRCCRHPLTVDFESFGWDWVIAPKKYEAHFCMGDCPFAFMQRYPNTHVVHLASPPGYDGPCCSPKKVGAINMLHFNHEMNVMLNSVPAMVVDQCGCS